MFRVFPRPRLISTLAANVPRYRRNLHEAQKPNKRPKIKKTTFAKPSGNAIAAELYKRNGFGKRKVSNQQNGDRSRLNIVSNDLCDDIIDRIALSLQKHANCDIIDVNPGVGLWSSKLHDAVKPRTHLLMEPDTDIYLPFLKPLLERKDSTYKLIPESGILWDNLNKLESENYLPRQKLYPPGDSHLEESNDSLLFVANLGYYPDKVYHGFPSITALVVHQLLSAIRTHSLFHGYGLVRMLIWMRDKEKKLVLPRVISQRRKFSVEAEISCENILEIAGSDEPASNWRREHSLDLESSRLVMGRMDTARIETPTARISTLQNQAAQSLDALVEPGARVVRPFQKDLDDMESRYARREFCSFHDKDGKPVYLGPGQEATIPRNGTRTSEWDKLLQLRYRMNQANKIGSQLDRLLLEYESIISEQNQLEGLNDDDDVLQKRSHLQERLSAWNADVCQLNKSDEALWQRIDDRRAFRQDPAILLWDQRGFEPLKVTEYDFFPQREMCLLDIQPKPIWHVLQGKNISNYDYFEFMIAALFINPTQSVVRGMKSLAPGAAEWIFPRCPSLNNTAQGGVMDLEQLSVRTLNQQMLREIIEAWMDWPFRPSKADMIRRMGDGSSESNDDDPNASTPSSTI